MSFEARLLSFSFTPGGSGGAAKTLSLQGLRATCDIDIVAGGLSSGKMVGAIYGMTLSQMNQLTTLGKQMTTTQDNRVQVKAGTEKTGLALVFEGFYFSSWMDGSAQPNVPFRFQATADGKHRVNPTPSTTVKGRADVATLMGTLAGQMGLSFEGNGVNVKVMNPYLYGAARLQVHELAEASGILHLVDRGKLATWTPTSPRSGGPFLISPKTGMKGYPRFQSSAVVVESIFKPEVECGKKIQVKSDVTAANGVWLVYNITYQLDSKLPHGRWFQTMYATPVAENTT